MCYFMYVFLLFYAFVCGANKILKYIVKPQNVFFLPRNALKGICDRLDNSLRGEGNGKRGRRVDGREWNRKGREMRTLTCVGWQVTLCDPIWQLTSRSCEMGTH